MFTQASSNTKKREDFLEQAKQARENRATDHQRHIATIKIQAFVRGFLVRKRTWEQTRKELQSQILAWTFDCTQDSGSNGNDAPKLPPALQVFLTAKRFLKSYSDVHDRELFLTFCRYLVSTLSTDSLKASYVGVALNKEHALCWIAHIKLTLALCLTILVDLKPESPHDSRSLVLILHTLVSYTSINNWAILDGPKIPEALKPGFQNMCNNIMGHLVDSDMYARLKVLLLKGLCRSRPSLKHSSLMAIVTLASRPLWAAEGSSKILSLFTMHIMSVPALVHHLKEITPEIMTQFISHSLLDKTLGFLDADQNLRIVFHTLEGSLALCLLANIVHLTFLHAKELDPRLLHVVTRILEHCQHYVVSKKSNLSRWHPILGWFCQSSDLEHKTICDVHESMPFVKQQLQYLYAPPLSTRFWTCLEGFSSPVPEPPSDQEKSFANLFKKRTGPKVTYEPVKYKKLGSNECTQVALVCNMYQVALTTLTQLRLDILTALSVQECFLKRLWNFLAYLGPCYGLKQCMDLLVRDTKALSPECKLLQMVCETTNHLITVLDDIEMYEEQKPFSPLEYSRMALFLNNFMFKAISNSLIDANELTRNNLFTAAHTLLMVLYRRDCRRRFTTDKNHWLIKDLRISQFMADLERGKKSAQLLLQKMPHVFPLEERILLFRKYVHSERIVLGLTESACASPQSFLITVRRSRLVEDAFRQLVDLPPQSFKGIIRVKFINEQGLDEAGIDQDGVFKEFLEETIRKLFDPSLNLFRVTSDNRVYPSPTSHATESHLQLIEFAGRLLGKALYENLTINVPLAAFFLNQVAHHHNQNALYSAMDELPSLDPELYRSLTSVKNYPGDITDLSLTFAIDDEFLGQLTTHELRPGGKAITVTNENKISYVHLMAHFRMHTQIKEQTAAFVRGFRALIQTDWLTLFSIPELQRLLGDDKSPIDLEDLRRNTQYYGGFHDSHRVICWLWDVLDNDFSDDERKLFLKFVTSCSQPPLLGFSHLQPPFSIRCVEVGDDEDHGDTIGSVIRGFFTIRKRDPVNRLPTSSTCFNLLKLPNYQKRSTLKEKLRYAITSNTGFELS